MKSSEILNDIKNILEKHKVVLFTIFVFLLNFILKIIFLDKNDIAGDEPFSVYYAQMRIPEIIAYLKSGNNPPLYEILLHFWIKLSGISTFGVRLPSLIFSCITAIVIFRIGKTFFSFSTGVVASLIFTFATIHAFFAHEARVYPLLALLASLSFLLLMKYIFEKKKIFLVLLCLTDILLIYAHYLGFFMLLNQIVSLFFFKQTKKSYKQIALVAGIVVLSFVPMIISFVRQFNTYVEVGGAWVESDLVKHYYGFLNIFINNKYNSFIFLASLFLLILYYFTNRKSLITFIEKDKRKPVLLVFLWFFIPYTLMFLASFEAPMYIERYVLFTSVFFYLALTSIICVPKTNKVLKVSIIFIFLSGMVLSFNNNPTNYRDIAKAVAFVKENKTDSTLVFVCPDYDFMGFTYHYNRSFFADFSQTKELLENDNVFLISTKAEVLEVLSEHKCKQVIYFQSVSEYVDPHNEIFNLLEHNYKLQEQKKFVLIFTVSVFKSIN